MPLASAGEVQEGLLEAAAQGPVSFLVFLESQADRSAAGSLSTKEEKGQLVFETLRDHATRTQSPIVAQLEAANVEYRPFWIANMIEATGDVSLIEQLALRGDVRGVYANPRVRADLPEPIGEEIGDANKTVAPEWNLIQIGAPTVWALGYEGQGVVVGVIDTGTDWEHPALIGKYRGSLDGVSLLHI